MPSPRAVSRARGFERFAWLTFALVCVGAVVAAQVLVGPLTTEQVHLGRAMVAIAGIVLTFPYAYLRLVRGRRVFELRGPMAIRPFAREWWLMLLATIVVLVGVQNYYHFAPARTVNGCTNSLDTGYHYLNGKYFRELGYTELYPAILVIDEEEGAGHLSKIRSYRDLTTDKFTSRRTAFEHADEIRARFGDRWDEFAHDGNFFIENWSKGAREYFFTDHGFNAPPTWTIVGGTLSEIVPVERVALLTVLDIFLLAGAFTLVTLAFGLDGLFACLLFFACCYAGRWPIVGVNLLRHDWIAGSLACVALLALRRPGLAGVGLAVAAWARIFPGVLIWPFLCFAVAQVASAAKDERRTHLLFHLRFVGGGLGASVLLVGLACAVYGVAVMFEFWECLKLHAELSGYNIYKSGFGDFLLYDGELAARDLTASGGLSAKRRLLLQWHPTVKVIGYASVVLVGVWAMSRVKTLRVHDTLHAAILPFFVFTNPQVQYFNIRYLLFLHHLGGDRFRFRDGLGIVILLSTEVVANYSHWFGNGRYAQTSLTSVGIALYFASQIPFMFGDIVRGLRPEGRSALLERFLDRLAVVGPALGLALSFTVFSAYWSRGTPIGHERVRTRADVSRKRETGSDVRQEGVLRVKRPTWIEVGRKPANQPFVEVAFAPKNRFVLEFRRGSKVLGKVKVSAKKSQRKKKGMHVRTFKVPDAAVEQGYTYVRVVPSKPVRLGHLRLLEHDSDE